jgi:hypothetical protein
MVIVNGIFIAIPIEFFVILPKNFSGFKDTKVPYVYYAQGSVAKIFLTTFYSRNESALATVTCVASEFLQ